MTPAQLDAYFTRINWRPAKETGPEILHALHRRHPCVFPFENLTPLLGQTVALDTETLCKKMLTQGRGGYCFEQNRLMADVLETLGFKVQYLAARVHWQNPADNILPRTHVVLKVDCDDEAWLVDVGFGGLTPMMPLRLQSDIVQRGSHETFLLSQTQALYTLQVGEGPVEGTVEGIVEGIVEEKAEGRAEEKAEKGQWQAMYSFDLQPQELVDLEMMNWYVNSHPQSRFIRQLVAARREESQRYTLLDNTLRTYQRDGSTERLVLETAASLRAVLQDQLRIAVPEDPAVDKLLARLIEQQASAEKLHT